MRYQTQANLTLDKGDLILTSRYHPGLVEDIKALPYHDRSYQPADKTWRIKYQWGKDVQDLVYKHLGQVVQVPPQVTYSAEYIQTRLFRVEYIGSIRERDDGSLIATGFMDKGWNIIFPYSALKEWFGQEQKPDEAPTFYAVLGVKRKASPDEIKKAYRLAARTWHPDVNKEPDAHEQFIKIQNAYEILKEDMTRRKYDAALKFEKDYIKKIQRQEKWKKEYEATIKAWNPPVRCGWLMVEGTESLGRFFVQKIIQWNSITNETGLSMVSYWPKGADTFKVEFI